MGTNQKFIEEQDQAWMVAPTPLDRVQAVRHRLAAFEITDLKPIQTILGVLDCHGLFHEPTPEPRTTSKQTRRQAKKVAKELRGRITRIREEKEPAGTEREALLAEQWDRSGEAAMQVEEQKVLSETYQTRRGGRIIPRYPDPGDRSETPQGRRPAREVIHALQILERYLKERYGLSQNRCDECLAEVLRAAMGVPTRDGATNNRHPYIERVRTRLKEAQPLEDFDYRVAIGEHLGSRWQPATVSVKVTLAPGSTKGELPGVRTT